MTDREMSHPTNRPPGPLPPVPASRVSSPPSSDMGPTAPEQVGDQTRGIADQAREKGQDVLNQVQEKGQQAASTAEEAVDSGIERAADAAHGLAGTLREKAEHLPGERTTELAYQAARGLERGADYLRDTSVVELRSELEGLIRRHPTESLVAGLAIGFLLARAVR